MTPIAPSRSTIVSTQPCTSVFESVFSIEENVKRSVMLFTAPVYESISATFFSSGVTSAQAAASAL